MSAAYSNKSRGIDLASDELSQEFDKEEEVFDYLRIILRFS